MAITYTVIGLIDDGSESFQRWGGTFSAPSPEEAEEDACNSMDDDVSLLVAGVIGGLHDCLDCSYATHSARAR